MLTAFLIKWYKSSGNSGATPRHRLICTRENWNVSNTKSAENTEDLGPSDELHLGNTLTISEDHTDLRRSKTLLGELQDLVLSCLSIQLVPRRRRAAVREGSAGDTLSRSVHASHG
jgi:hypothetical protein